jgi:hypothetical protein
MTARKADNLLRGDHTAAYFDRKTGAPTSVNTGRSDQIRPFLIDRPESRR